MNFKMKSTRMVAAIFAASLILSACVQEQSGVGPVVQDNSKPSASIQDVIRSIVGNWATDSSISLFVDPDYGDTSYVVSRYKERLNDLRNIHGVAVAFKKKRLEAYQARILAGENGFANPNNYVHAPKSSQTRWNASENDVKALTEVHQIKVYFEVSGGSKMKPNWIAAAREAMTKWNNLANTQVTFVETNSPTDNDIRMRCALMGDGSGVTTWLTPDPWVEKDSTELFVNLGYESTIPHNQKVAYVMIGLGNVLNITHTNTEGGTFETGTFLHVDGTPYYDPTSLFQPTVGPDVVAAFGPYDAMTIQQLYPVWGGLGRTAGSNLISTGWEGPTTIATGVATYQYEGDTLYYLKWDGSLWRKIGPTGSSSQLWPTGSYTGALASFTVSKGYIAVQKTTSGGPIYTRRPNTTTWALQSGLSGFGTPKFKLAGERLVLFFPDVNKIYSRYLQTSPTYWSYEWEGTNTRDFAVYGNRLAVIENGDLFAMDGYEGWNYLWYSGGGAGSVEKVLISENTFAIFVEHGWGFFETLVQQGMYGGWNSYGAPETFQHADLCGDNFAVINYGGAMYILDGNTGYSYGHWVMPGHDLTSAVRLSGPMCDYVTKLDPYGQIWAKYSVSLSPSYLYYGIGFSNLQQRQ